MERKQQETVTRRIRKNLTEVKLGLPYWERIWKEMGRKPVNQNMERESVGLVLETMNSLKTRSLIFWKLE